MAGVFSLPVAVLAAMAVVMTVSWVVQRAANDAGWTDVFWTFGTGVTLALAAVAAPGATPWRALLAAGLVGVWSLRLGLHIARRVFSDAEDARYAESRREWGQAFQRNMFGLSLIQAPATALLSVSVVLAARAPGASLTPGDVAGAAVLALAVAGEAAADSQLRRFRADAAHRGRVCDVGLWAWSRHPNYAFEALAWCAWPLIAVRLSEPWTWASLTAPVVMFILLRFVSGVPPLEAAMLRSRGDAYRLYQARVSPMFPRPPRKDIR
jgi:steroid 5-alpha reductase family enzyme